MSNAGVALCRVLSAGLILALFLAGAARADIVRGLHAATVPVSGQSSRALAAASRNAMAEVLVKVSGSSAVLKNPAITEALAQSRSHVQQYKFVKSGDGLQAHFEFDATYITELVTGAGAPLWTANRPAVLAWVVLEDERGRYFLNWDSAPEQAQQLMDAFSRRGVPLQLPLFDLSDTAAISDAAAWRLDRSVISDASVRYGMQNVLAGRLAVASGGKWLGDWSYFHPEMRLDRAVTAQDFAAFAAAGAALVADDMAGRYAVTAIASEEGTVLMSVTGVADYADYAAIVSWLEGLELIERANIEQVLGNRIELRLHAQAEAVQLASIIELNERLQPVPVTVMDPHQAQQLSYQWRK